MRSRNVDILSVLAVALIAFWIATLAGAFGSGAGFVRTADGRPAESDFVGVYTAGKLTLAGEASAAYDADRHAVVQHELLGHDRSRSYPWSYPPYFLAVAAALAVLPFTASMLSWIGASGLFAATALQLITTSRRDFLLMLATPALWLNFYVGQNGALSAALVGFGLFALPSFPVVAGVFIGLLAFKPHLGILFPIALLAGGHYRAFAAAAATVCGLALFSIAAFGAAPWLAMPAQLRHISAIMTAEWSFEKIQTMYGFGRALGLPASAALPMQFALTAALAVGIGWVWRKRSIAYELKAAALAAAVTLATPYQFVYDLVVLTVAQAFLLRYLATRSASVIDLVGLGIANLLIFMFAKTVLPLGVVGCVVVLALIARRIVLDLEPAASPGRCPSFARPLPESPSA